MSCISSVAITTNMCAFTCGDFLLVHCCILSIVRPDQEQKPFSRSHTHKHFTMKVLTRDVGVCVCTKSVYSFASNSQCDLFALGEHVTFF
jgi:hypothetical protein